MTEDHEIVDVSEAGFDVEETPEVEILEPKPAAAPLGLLTGRAGLRSHKFGPEARRRGSGWTRPFRKGRKQRLPFPEGS